MNTRIKLLVAYVVLGVTWLTRRRFWTQVVAWAQRERENRRKIGWYCVNCLSFWVGVAGQGECSSCGSDDIVHSERASDVGHR